MSSDLPEHFGKLYRNLHSLEFLLRLRLYRNETKDNPDQKIKESADMSALKNAKVGDVLDQNWLTKNSYFSDILKEYNKAHQAEQLDRAKLCDIRNALSHAKFLFDDPNVPGIGINTAMLDNELTVVFKESLTEDWYNEQIKYVASVLQEVNGRI